MKTRISRRQALAAAALAAPMAGFASATARSETDGERPLLDGRLAALEQTFDCRLGVAVLNLGSGQRLEHRGDDRFLLCSTFKVLAAALVLRRVDRGEEALGRRVVITRDDLVPWSPVTEARIGGIGVTVGDLCAATVTLSDNTAANLLLASFGGPDALTAYVRALGDPVTRLDRIEPYLNEHDGPDDVRDTTTAAAMLETLRTLVFSEALSRNARAQLVSWLMANKTGAKRLRAGLPPIWLFGDKTGANKKAIGNVNDIGIAWPPDRAPVIVTCYCKAPSLPSQKRHNLFAEVGRIAASV